jgi:glycosyltransferase involved in cell wall biosynthesis
MRTALPVTIVTPSLNQGRFIRDAIESVLGQGYPDVEHIVLDGGSTDQTAAVVGEYAGRLTFIVEPDRGQSDAINRGFRKARGEIISWLNCDDVLLPGAIRKVVEVFERDRSLGAVYGDGLLLEVDGRVRHEYPRAGAMNVWKLVNFSDFLFQPAVFFRRSVLDEIGYLDESLHWGMDWDFLIRVAKRYRMAYVPALLAAQRDYETTKSASGGHWRFRELVRIMRRHSRYRYPPAYFVYGVETYGKLLSRAIQRWRPRLGEGRAARLEAVFLKVCEWAVLHTFKPAEGWYADRWATTQARFQFHREEHHLRIEGALPSAYPLLRGQTLEVIVDGRAVVRSALEVGDFSFLVPIEPGSQLVDVELRATRYFVPRREGAGDDPRKLSYLLDRIEWAR